ncbi:MAG TPA: hypothetical protein VKA84_25915 [Gemmatimonadaceae bacterium]|nr:hypothetical protein [Gemmatimonadaceae bacterium]
MTSDFWYNWWASRDQISIPASICPASAEGTPQTADAVIASGDWHQAYIVAAFITLAITLAGVLLTYETRVMGDDFKGHWWRRMSVSALLSALVSLVWLAWGAKVGTSGCEFGEVATRIPLLSALNRASVSLVQSGVLFFLMSWLLTRLARVVRRPGWVNNAHYPVR